MFKLDYAILDPREKTIDGDDTANTIVGRLDGSTINGLGGSDHLIGMRTKDKLNGGDGDDYLAGGLGKDILTGGAGDDMFEFNSVRDARKGDVIKDFGTGSDIDLIDLEGIDARMGGADNAFKFIGKQAFHHKKGELHYVKSKGFVKVEGDINGDGRADFQIKVDHVNALSADDFIL